ncbi:unnamed protein product [Didymodactylos carnosus]|uniref:Purple acid phosphatase n=1 Tax=Didymodactylos carnosus TaxID=1234261 RepID=A0A813PUZ3_9BILA|nr:unnamed protein product [Didymodactylos carnosus]CAF0758190.1 unnamed protein product [Didymodactylos carnosus]CAF3502702.1 unnamed protein product [Didymodactylos carnosus]CAF3538714.1 unnamed protein product [Didymodactylos carnosus]
MPSPYSCQRGTGVSDSSNAIILEVSSTAYNAYDIINVTWTSTTSTPPCADDFIAVFFPEISVNLTCSYLDYEFIGNTTEVEGNQYWEMINLRRILEFRYYQRQNCTGNYTYKAGSPIIHPINYNEPTGIHLSYTSNDDEMIVMYTTSSNIYTPEIQYGLDPSQLQFNQTGTTDTYSASDMCEGKANITGPQNFIDPGYIHTILLKNLMPATIYFYRVGNEVEGWSPVIHFISKVVDGASDTLSFIAYGDMGVSPVQTGAAGTMDRVHERVLQGENIAVVLHIGDVSYARGIGALWDRFMTEIQPIAQTVPYMLGVGNHEYDHVQGGQKDPSHAPGDGGFRPKWGDYGYDSGGECAVPIVHRFSMPDNGNGPFWYSFNLGSVHILMFSTEHNFTRASDQYLWIENDLRSVDRAVTPWIITASHRPMYASETDEADLIKLMLQLYLEPLLYKYQVDINIFAHKHSYERSCQMYRNECNPNGTVHLLIGMAGQNLDDGQYSNATWSQYHDQEFGYTQFIVNRTDLHFMYFHNKDNQLADEVYLRKK